MDLKCVSARGRVSEWEPDGLTRTGPPPVADQRRQKRGEAVNTGTTRGDEVPAVKSTAAAAALARSVFGNRLR